MRRANKLFKRGEEEEEEEEEEEPGKIFCK
jgi:hypothetical protein